MSQFDCDRDARNLNFKCTANVNTGEMVCMPMERPPPDGPAFPDQVIAGTSLEPALLGWHVIVILFVIVIACGVAAVVLYYAYKGGSPPDREKLVQQTDLILNAEENGGTVTGVPMSTYTPTYTGGGGTTGLQDTSVGMYGNVPEAPTYTCDVCGKEYHFMSDVDAHKAARHAS
jgi:hypothetical protein